MKVSSLANFPLENWLTAVLRYRLTSSFLLVAMSQVVYLYSDDIMHGKMLLHCIPPPS